MSLTGDMMKLDGTYLVKLLDQQTDCEFSLRFFLQKDEDSWKNCFTMLKLVKEGIRNEIKYDYGKYVLEERILGIPDGLKLISDIFPKNNKNGKFTLDNYCEFETNLGGESEFKPSKARYSIQENMWPIRFSKLSVIEGQKGGQSSNRDLLKEGMPYYPKLDLAVLSFFNLGWDNFSSFGGIYVIIPDYRARIESLRLIFSKAEVKLVNPEIEYNKLIVKVFAESGTNRLTLKDIFPKSEIIKFDIGFSPNSLYVALISRPDNMKIDSKEYSKWSTEEEGVFIERPEEEIISLIQADESQILEKKGDINNKKNRNDFIESVVAFLNTNRGLIIVGVDDDGKIIGSKKKKEDLKKLIHDCIEPPPKHVQVDEKLVLNDKIILVEVPEGEEKPYQSRTDKNWYVRHNDCDNRMERSELFQMLEKYMRNQATYPSY